jgi:glutamate-1-semialdehyde 2,1-aminomutase
MKISRYEKSQEYLQRALKTIPLGAQTFSKSITQYPYGVSPLFVTRGKGSHVWDIDGNEYIDYVNALAAIIIGYVDETINESVRQHLDKGVTFSLSHPIEAEVAEIMVDMIPCAEKVRFGKNGTDATSAAIRLARAYTKRDHVLVCGYHGWQDWYIGSTSRDLGVPEKVKSLTHTFQYNDIESLEKQLEEFSGHVAAVIMEPMNIAWPKEDFLKEVKKLAHDHGSLLIFDETITGFRFAKGGAQEFFGVTPDLATFGKSLGNGFPISAVVGRADIMDYMVDIFFSSTFGGETISLVAAKTVLKTICEKDVIKQIYKTGESILTGIQDLICKYSASDLFDISGHPSWSFLTIKDMKPYKQWEIKTLFLQEMFKRGILTLGTHNICYQHTQEDIETLLNAYDEIIPFLLDVVKAEALFEYLDAEPIEPLFTVR